MPREFKIILVLGLILLCLQAIACFRFALSNDDSEAMHVGWLIKQGKVPYVDFFEHHHALLYYLIAVLFFIKETIFLPKAFLFLIYLGNLFLMFKIAGLFSFSKNQKTLYLFLVIAFQPFIWSHFFLRPECLMTFFILLCLYLYFLAQKPQTEHTPSPPNILPLLKGGKGLRRGKRTWLFLLMGVFSGLAFLSLQKAVLFILSFFILLVFDLIFNRQSRKNPFLFGLGFVLTILPYFIYLFLSRGFNDYWFFNFTFNKIWQSNASSGLNLFVESFKSLFLRNPLLWLLMPFCLGFFVFRASIGISTTIHPLLTPPPPFGRGRIGGEELCSIKKLSKGFFQQNQNKIKLLFLALVQIAVGLAVIFVFKMTLAVYYLLLFFALALFFTALFLEKINPKIILALCLILFCIASLNAFKWILYKGQNNQVQNYILKNTNKNDTVWVFAPEFHPIFRRDAHFCWFLQNVCLKAKNQADTGSLEKILTEQRPKMVFVGPVWFPESNYKYLESLLEKQYAATPFEHLWQIK